jgi:hypothetical protein
VTRLADLLVPALLSLVRDRSGPDAAQQPEGAEERSGGRNDRNEHRRTSGRGPDLRAAAAEPEGQSGAADARSRWSSRGLLSSRRL